jgi:hypothetical protein
MLVLKIKQKQISVRTGRLVLKSILDEKDDALRQDAQLLLALKKTKSTYKRRYEMRGWLRASS